MTTFTHMNNDAKTNKDIYYHIFQINTGSGFSKKNDPTSITLLKGIHPQIVGISERNPQILKHTIMAHRAHLG